MKKIVCMFVPHAGCPQRCVFCHQPHITGVPLRTSVSPEDVRHTLETALSDPKSRKKHAQFEAAFYGGTFTGLPLSQQEAFLRTVQPYINRGDLAGIRLSTHPGMFNEDIFALLAAFSVSMIELGVQSFDHDVLRQARRGHSAEDAERTIQRLQQLGIKVGIHLMTGLPGDSEEKCLYSTRRTLALGADSVRIHPTLVIQGTQLEALYRQHLYTPFSLDAAVQTCKAMLMLFQNQHIPVIRIGLQPTESLERRIVAGPYHPAFRQLVESAIMYDRMKALCTRCELAGSEVTFQVSPQDVSRVRGQKNSNLMRLQQEFPVKHIRILESPALERGQMYMI